MTRTKLGEHFRNLFRRSNANIGDQAAMQGVRVIEVEHTLGEIGAVVRSQVEMRLVRRRIILADQSIVPLWGSFNLETVNGAIVRRSHELVPVAAGSFAILRVGRYVFQIFAAV